MKNSKMTRQIMQVSTRTFYYNRAGSKDLLSRGNKKLPNHTRPHMPDTTGIMRACSDGDIAIETEAGSYCLSREEIRELLFFGRQPPLRQHDGIIDGNAIIYPTSSKTGIIIRFASAAYLVPRCLFVLMAKGQTGSVPVAWISRG